MTTQNGLSSDAARSTLRAQSRNIHPKLLFLAHPFPPGRSIGSVRAWNIVKHLSRLGWEITVVTPQPKLRARFSGENSLENSTELENVRYIFTGHNWRCLNPTALSCWNEGLGKLSGGFLRHLARRMSIDSGQGWIKPAEKACDSLTKNDVDLILATGSPFAAFQLAGRLAIKLGRPYVLDYRDPWTVRSRRLPSRVIRREEKLLQGAGAAITVSPTWANTMRDRFNLDKNIHVITNGYDPEEADRVIPLRFDHFAIVYAGTFYPPRRVVTPLMAALSQLKNHKTVWYFHYYGRHQAHVAEEAAKYGLTDRVVQHGYVPREECLSAVRGASVALVINPANVEPTAHDLGWIPAKLFELLGLDAPLLFIGATEGDAAKIVRETVRGGVFTAQNVGGIASFLSGLMDARTTSSSNRDAYSWTNLAITLDRVLRVSAGIPSLAETSGRTFVDGVESASGI